MERNIQGEPWGKNYAGPKGTKKKHDPENCPNLPSLPPLAKNNGPSLKVAFTPNVPPKGPLKVAEHSFQVPMPPLTPSSAYSPLLLNYLSFGTHFLQESRLITEVFILAFWLGCVLLPWQWGWLQTRLK